jgi:predicted NUDIX family phosphoesterase
MSELVLVVPTHKYNFPEPITNDIRPLWSMMQDARLMVRAAAEEDPTFKQLIPYIILECDDEIFTYHRKGTEQRLHGFKSCGIGGHINHTDIFDAIGREINEEVEISSRYLLSFMGFINDNSTPVNQVHLGMLWTAILEEPNVRPRDETKGGQFESIYEINPDEFETWSQHALGILL